MRVQLHAIAAGVGLTYELLTGDLSQVNYSSIRAGLLEFRRRMEALQWQLLVPGLCRPVVAAVRRHSAGDRRIAGGDDRGRMDRAPL
jgi:capsid protein